MLSQIKKPVIKIRTLAVNMMLLMAAFLMVPIGVAQAATTQPTISVIAVNPNENVQLMIYNLPANTDFTVTESAAGHLGMGPVIAHFNSLDGGTRSYWFEILTDVRTYEIAEIRIDSGTGIYAYTTFDPSTSLSNTSSSSSATTTTTTSLTTPSTDMVSPTLGTIQALHAQKGGYVVAELKGLPLDTQFTVTVGTAGSQGLDGFVVGSLSTGNLSDHVGTFEIPVDLSGERSLDLRIEAPGGYLYLVTFANTDF